MNRIVHPIDDRRTEYEKKHLVLRCIGEIDEWLLVMIPAHGAMVRAVKKSAYVFDEEVKTESCDDLI